MTALPNFISSKEHVESRVCAIMFCCRATMHAWVSLEGWVTPDSLMYYFFVELPDKTQDPCFRKTAKKLVVRVCKKYYTGHNYPKKTSSVYLDIFKFTWHLLCSTCGQLSFQVAWILRDWRTSCSRNLAPRNKKRSHITSTKTIIINICKYIRTYINLSPEKKWQHFKNWK